MTLSADAAAAAPGQTLAARVTGAPRLTDSDAAHARVSAWLDEAANGESADAARRIRRVLHERPIVAELVAAIAEASPYLWELTRADPGRFAALLLCNPEQRLESVMADAARVVAGTDNEDEVMRALRRLKGEAALLIALADIGGVWPTMQVARALTQFAGAAVGAAVEFVLAEAVERGRITPPKSGAAVDGSGYVVVAMGKMGAFELNYSSDIDLIVFYDAEAPSVVRGVEPAPPFVRMTQRLVKLLNTRTGDGYVFRTDLRLRPDPASTQIAISTAAALDYYESLGQNWERAAMIKARVCAGDAEVGAALLHELSPFIWRKYLDYAAIADVHAMKRQIHAYRGHGEIAVEGHNVKLGRGGIREIEFFVQTQQLIAGGRHPELRGRETLPMLDTLVEGGWIDPAARTELSAAYVFLRTVEHRLQMVADEQTHTLPSGREAVERFARFLGFADRDAFAAELVGHLRNVQRHYASLFENAPEAEASRRALTFPSDRDDVETLDKLLAMGFRKPLEVSAIVRRWFAGDVRSLRGEAAREHLAAVVPVLLEHVARSENPETAIIALDRFLGALHGGARLLSLLRQNRDLIALMALVLGTAPRLADMLALHPQVMDAVIDPSFFGPLPEESELYESLNRTLEQAGGYEDFLDRVRIFGQEHMFLIGTRILSGTASAEQAGEAFARLADVLIRALCRAVEEQFVQVHGRLKGQEWAVLALGKLGGREMTAASDLDLIVVYDFDEEASQSDGERPLSGSQYFARLTQRLISALTAQTNYGALYHVDMRLRPSGRSGPLATRYDGFARYQEEEAWTWEHMALTRARVVAASPEFTAKVEAVIGRVLRRQRDAELVAGDVAEMRKAVAAEKPAGGRWDLKYADGGLVDTEFIAQYLQLAHAAEHPELLDTATARVLDKAWRLGLLSAEDAEVLRPAVRLYQNLTQILRLCLPGAFDPKATGSGLLALLANAADVPDFATLDAFVAETQVKVRACFDRLLGVAQ